jgi:hypothetical protein
MGSLFSSTSKKEDAPPATMPWNEEMEATHAPW